MRCPSDYKMMQVPPMPAAQTREVIESELNAKLEQVFEWIDLDKPLGSASISQVSPMSCAAMMAPLDQQCTPCSLDQEYDSHAMGHYMLS